MSMVCGSFNPSQIPESKENYFRESTASKLTKFIRNFNIYTRRQLNFDFRQRPNTRITIDTEKIKSRKKIFLTFFKPFF